MMITTQQIPAMLALWEKNREKKVFARQKAGKIGSFWGNAFRSKVGTLELRSTCVQSNRLIRAGPPYCAMVGCRRLAGGAGRHDPANGRSGGRCEPSSAPSQPTATAW